MSSSSEGDSDPPRKPGGKEKENLNGRHKKEIANILGDPTKNVFDSYVFSKDAHNRVKMYVLIEQRLWDDRGTGHVACVSAPDNPNSYSIIVRLENDEQNLLESKIQVDTIYQKQQETLIVWSETETCDLALSFQEKGGCEEIWETICRVQGKDPEEMLYDNDSDGESSEPSPVPSTSNQQGNSLLPPCEIGKLADIENVLANALATPDAREKMAFAVEQQGYIEKLCDVFRQCEELKLLDGCRTLYMIAKNLFYLNRANLLEQLLDEKNLRPIVGMLEYDPAAPCKRKHREFLFEQSRFREVLPIQKEELRERIHDNFRAQYVQEVCLPAPSILEENLLTVLASHLFFNRIEIVKMLSEDRVLIKQLFDELKDKNTTVLRRKELAGFLKEFCSYSQSLQPNGPQGREMFLKLLMSNDVLAAVELCIISPDHTTRSITVELLTLIAENNPTFVRDYLVHQSRNISESNNDDLLMNRMIRHIFKDRDPELTSAQQMGQVLKILVDPENMTAKSDKTEFLPFFYRRCIMTLVQPLLDNTENGVPAKDTYYVAHQQSLILELLSFCIQHHSFSMRNYCMHHDLLNRVLVLLKSKHHFLALYALRLFRRVLNLRDEFYVKYIHRESVINHVVEAFVANGKRYNVMNSAILEMFEFIAHENVSLLVTYTVDHYWEQFESVDYVETFRSLRKRYEANKREREGSHDSVSSDTSSSVRSEQWKKEQECDKEENWFGSGDDEDECWSDKKLESVLNSLPSSTTMNGEPPAQRKSGMEPNYPSIAKRPTSLLDEDGVATVFGGSSITAPINGNKLSISAPKIVIKMPAIPSLDRSRSPSPAASTSRSPSPSTTTTSPSKSQSPSPSPPATPYMLKEVGNFSHGGLVDYDDDSDDEDEAPSPSNSQSSSAASTSSSSSPTEEETPPTEAENEEDSKDEDRDKEKVVGMTNGHVGNGKRPRSFEPIENGDDDGAEGSDSFTDVERDFTPERKRCRLDQDESKSDETTVPSPTATV